MLPAAHVSLGDDVFLSSAWHDLHGRCVGVITNQTGVTSRLENIVDAIREHGGICIRAIYAPEHGLRGDRPAGAFVPSYTDARSGLPVYSLYGSQRHPTAQMLRGVDVLLFDIQDVGDRAYTYISTMAYAMQAAKQYHKSIWILDRPNPIGGTIVEGPVLEKQFSSFIGLYPIAMRHGMTVGELARMFNDAFGIDADLRVVEMRGWHRRMLWPDTGLQWVQTSPNIPEWTTALVYPCTGLIASAGLNAGIGTTKPFKYAGAQNLDPFAFAAALNARDLPGVFFRAAYWSPVLTHPAPAVDYSGVELDVFDPYSFQAVRTAVTLLTTAREVSPASIVPAVKLMEADWGTDAVVSGLESNESASQIVAQWRPALERFLMLRARYLLYD